MSWNLSGFAGDKGPWALLILIGGIILVGAILWSPIEGLLTAAGASVPDSGSGVFLGLLLILGGVLLYMWHRSR